MIIKKYSGCIICILFLLQVSPQHLSLQHTVKSCREGSEQLIHLT